ncbi:phosphatase PAP2 family protein [Anaerofustis sp.]|uniref:phosphatase PAP2 family protein n=1 Tax=Anaerofustis sp. TaxID=1872517 RepID=UPI0025BB4C18|nr:phosphatase PAP2 family protein [Anaerofustis sp.]
METGKLKKYFDKYFKWVAVFLFVLLFFYLCIELTENELSDFDFFVYNSVAQFISPNMTKIFRFITRFGSLEVILPLCILVLLFLRNKNKIILMIVNMLSIVTINQGLKMLFARPRPAVVRLAEASGFSFPSGHTMCSLAFYGFLLYLLLKSDYTPVLKWIGSICICFLIFFIGISRIYLGVHYCTDVVAGFSISIAYLIIFTDIVNKIVYKNNKMN